MTRWFSLIIRVILGILFFVSGLAKMLNFSDFLFSLTRFTSIPDFLIFYIAYILPILEVSVGILLIGGILLKWTARGVFILLLIFTIIVFIEYANGNIINCYCFGPLMNARTDLIALFRNIILSIAAFVLMKPQDYFLSFDNLMIRDRNRKLTEPQKQNHLEILSTITILVLISLGLSLMGIHLLRGNYFTFQTPEARLLHNTKSQFMFLENTKKKLQAIEPATDSILILNLNPNVSIYERYLKSQYKDRYLGINKNFQCELCKDINLLLKISSSFIVENIILLENKGNLNKSNFLNQFINQNLFQPFGSGYPVKIIAGEEKWCYHFIFGLREAAIAVKGSYLYKK